VPPLPVEVALRRLSISVLAVSLGLVAPVASSDVPTPASYELDVTFDPQRSFMEGVAVLRFPRQKDPVHELTLYLHGELRFDSIRLGDRDLPVHQDSILHESDYSLVARRAVVETRDSHMDEPLTVRYSGYFHPSQARSPSDYMRVEDDGVLLRSYYYSIWFPVVLGPGEQSHVTSFPSVVIRTPRDFHAVFTGSRVREDEDGESRVSQWRAEDVEVFDAQCTARRFAILQSGETFVYHAGDASSREVARGMVGFLERLREAYRTRYRRDAIPGQLHILQMPRYGNISSGNVVGIAEDDWRRFGRDPRVRRLVAHELVHPFVAFETPASDALYALAAEGFPAYFHLPVVGALLGDETYEDHLQELEALYLSRKATGRDRRGEVPPEKPLAEIGPGELGLYKDGFVLGDRALLFMDYLRRSMGEERFGRFAVELLNRESLSYVSFRETVLLHLPGAEEDLRLWLETTEFPPRFRRSRP